MNWIIVMNFLKSIMKRSEATSKRIAQNSPKEPFEKYFQLKSHIFPFFYFTKVNLSHVPAFSFGIRHSRYLGNFTDLKTARSQDL